MAEEKQTSLKPLTIYFYHTRLTRESYEEWKEYKFMLHTLFQIIIYAYMIIGLLLAVETGKGNYHKKALEIYLLITVFITLGRSVKRFVFHYCRAVYLVLCVTSVDVTVFTSVADFPATVPRIPCIVHNFKSR